jgi:hypothetical protein
MPGKRARQSFEGRGAMPQQGERNAGAASGPGEVPGWARLALAACLLALIAVALRARVPAPALDGAFRHDGLLVGVVLEAALGCLMIALAVRNARAPKDAVLAAQLRKLLFYVVGAGLVAIPASYLLSRHVRPLPPRRTPKTSGRGAPSLRHARPPSSVALHVELALALLLAAAILAWLIYLLATHFGPGTWRLRRRAPGITLQAAMDEDGEAGLGEAVESGRRALWQTDDARAAIIACYVAMEQHLAGAGTGREVADTPDELLTRAAGRGLVRGAAAARLTALFYEARFSSHPMPQGRRGEAEQALAELADSLSDQDLAGAGSRAGGGGPDGAAPGESR